MGSSQPAYTAVVFDMDGLLLDSERPIRDAWLRVAATLGVRLDEADYLGVVGLNHPDSWARMLALFGRDETLLATAQRRVDDLLAAGPPFAAKPGAARLLQALREAGIACGVASSTHRAEVRRRLSRADLPLEHFDAICGGDEVQHGKPHPEPYEKACALLGVDPRDCVVLEDSATGARSGNAAGAVVVGIPHVVGIPAAPRRVTVPTLVGLDPDGLTTLFAQAGRAQ